MQRPRSDTVDHGLQLGPQDDVLHDDSEPCCRVAVSAKSCEPVSKVEFALGVEHGHRALGEVAAVAGLPFVVDVGEDGADEAESATR